jgi:methylmalonyl-CoA/ethylmalonyl-CoA epimerase
MKFDHIGIFCKNLEFGRKKLIEIFPILNLSKEFHDPLLKVSVQFLYDSNNFCYELVAPNGLGNPVDSILKNKKNILNHIAYKVYDFDLTIEEYRNFGCLPLTLPQPAIAFNGARVIFFLTPVDVIVELIEVIL